MKNKLLNVIAIISLLVWTQVAHSPSAAKPSVTGKGDIGLADPVTPAKPVQSNPPKKKLPGQFSGNASWYGVPFHGRRTASGDIFNMNKLTAAHLRLPLPTKVFVENPRNGSSIVVKVNDRGPYVKNRVMDLSREGARQLGTLGSGIGYVECMVLPSSNGSKASKGNLTAGPDNK